MSRRCEGGGKGGVLAEIPLSRRARKKQGNDLPTAAAAVGDSGTSKSSTSIPSSLSRTCDPPASLRSASALSSLSRSLSLLNLKTLFLKFRFLVLLSPSPGGTPLSFS